MQSVRDKLLFAGDISVKVAINDENDKAVLIFQKGDISSHYPIPKALAEGLIDFTSLSAHLFCLILSREIFEVQIEQRLISKKFPDLGDWLQALQNAHGDKSLAQSIKVLTQKPSDSIKADIDQADNAKTDLINDQPQEVLLFILSYLPLTDVKNAMLVCQTWYSLMKDNFLWRRHLESLPFFDNKEIANNPSRDEIYFYKQFLKVLKNKFQYSPEINGLINPSINGDLSSLLTAFHAMQAKSRRAYQAEPLSLETLQDFTIWLEKKGTIVTDILCVFKHQSILDLLFDSKMLLMSKMLGLYSIYNYTIIDMIMSAAVRFNQIEKLKLLIKIQGKLPLYLLNEAAKYNHLDVLKMLLNTLQNGVKSIANNNIGPLDGACQKGHIKALQLLLDNGFKDEINKAYSKRTPLMHAVCDGHLNIVKLLIKYGVEMNLILDCIKYLEELNINEEEKTAIQQELQKGLTEAKNKNQLNERVLNALSQKTNMQKIEALCRFYIKNNKPKSMFKNSDEFLTCKRIIALIKENNLTIQTFFKCGEKWRSVKPEMGLFHTMLTTIEELLNEKKEVEQDLSLTTTYLNNNGSKNK